MGLGGRGGDAAAVWNLEASKARGWPVEEHSAGSWVFAGEALHRRRLVGSTTPDWKGDLIGRGW